MSSARRAGLSLQNPHKELPVSIQSANAYINYEGQALAAIRLYERALGATVEAIQRHGEVPGMDVPAATRIS